MFDALQILLSAPVGMKKIECCPILLGSSPAVSLFFQQLTQQIVGFESGALFNGGGKIAAQQANAKIVCAVGA